MKFALVNPAWTFAGSTYFGCQDAHYPLELLFASDQIQAAGHEALLIDAHLERRAPSEVKAALSGFDPDFLVIPTAPSYLFWRCPPPELRVPQQWFRELGTRAVKVAIGPHPSATPRATLSKLNCDVAMRGEVDETIAQLASKPWSGIEGCCWRDESGVHVTPSLGAADMKKLGALTFRNYAVERRSHRHHVFHGTGRGAELEFARGCPWACTFCNKTLFRNRFRERSPGAVLEEVDTLISRGVDYIYWIDEIFGVGRAVRGLLEELARRQVTIGLQTRIDLWDEESLDLLARAHCVSMECGIESITDEGRAELNKNCRISTGRITELLVYARQRIPWVQANLILTEHDERGQVRAFQENLRSRGVWVSEPVPLFAFPGTADYLERFGPPDDLAWERAHQHYLASFRDKGFSDIQDEQPVSIGELECTY
ncbi:MAG: TIGR04295 family B12-binding domain-containing radical SAM protein [Acidobacteria bacterium]|nr:TIGR04295 family B12-binding domain-containing radical SAM protein [Acidobacteriota bacterium]